MPSTFKGTIEQNGKTYDVVCSNYGNRIMILISDIDLQKMGTMVRLHPQIMLTCECCRHDERFSFPFT